MAWPFSWILIFLRDSGVRAMYQDRASRLDENTAPLSPIVYDGAVKKIYL